MFKRISTTLSNSNSRLVGFGKDLFAYGAMEAIGRLVSFLLLPIFTRIFSQDSYGAIDVIAALTNLFTIFIALGLPSAVHRYFYEYEQKHERKALVSSVLLVSALAGLVSLAIGWTLKGPISMLLFDTEQYDIYILLGIAYSIFAAISSIAQSVLRLERRIVVYNLTNLVYIAIYAGLALTATLVLDMGLLGVFWSQIIAGVLQLAYCLYLIRDHLGLRLSRPKLNRAVKYGVPLTPALLVNWINSQTSRIILLATLGLDMVGVFGAAAKIATVVQLFTTIFQRTWFPFAMTLIKDEEKSRDRFYSQVLNYYVTVFMAIALVFSALSKEFVDILLPPEYADGYVIIPWIVGGIVLHASSQITTLGTVIAERSIFNSISAWLGAILNVVLTWLMVPVLGLYGAGVGTFLAELIFAGSTIYFSHRQSKIRFNLARNGTILGIYLAATFAILWTVPHVQGTALSLAVRGLIVLLSLGGIAALSYKDMGAIRKLLRSWRNSATA